MGPEGSSHRHDAFISYSRKDGQFANQLERALENYKPPRDLATELKVSRRNLDIFLDRNDFGVGDYHATLTRQLTASRKLLIICSPHARTSEYVNDEIHRFIEIRGAENVIPVLLSGLPNNEAKSAEEEEKKAFPEALCKAMGMPLACDYRGFDLRKDRVNRGRFEGDWYKIISNIYETTRSTIEQRERKRQARNRNVTIGIVSGIAVVLLAAFLVTLWYYRESERQRQTAVSRQLAAQALNHQDQALDLALLLSVEASQAATTVDVPLEAQRVLFASLAYHPRLVRYLPSAFSLPFPRVTFHPDGTRLASVGCVKFGTTDCEERTLQVWDTDSGRLLSAPFRTSVLPALLRVISFSKDGKTLGALDEKNTITLWDIENRKPRGQSVTDPRDFIESVAMSPDGKLVASSGERLIYLWEISTGRRYDLLPKQTDDSAYLGEVAFSPDASILASGSHDITLWDLNSRTPLRTLPMKLEVTSIIFSPDGRLLAIGGCANKVGDVSCEQGIIQLWDLQRQRPFGQPLKITGAWVRSIGFSPDGKKLASGSCGKAKFTSCVGGEIRVWDVANDSSDRLELVLFGHNSDVFSLAFSSTRPILASAGQDHNILLWDIRDRGELTGPSRRGAFPVTGGVFSPNGKILAAPTCGSETESSGSCKQSMIRLWDVATRQAIGQISLPDRGGIATLVFSPDSTTLVTGGCGEWEQIKSDASEDTATSEEICKKGVIHFWDVTSRQSIGQPLPAHNAVVSSLTVSSDGKTLASGSCGRFETIIGYHFCMQGEILLWDVRKRIPRGVALNAHESSITSLAFTADGSMLASGGCGKKDRAEVNEFCVRGEIRLWDVTTHQPRGRPLVGHGSEVGRFAFSPDGKWLVSAGDAESSNESVERDGYDLAPQGQSLILWQVATGQRVGEHRGDRVTDEFFFSQDGARVLARDESGVDVTLWDLHFDALRARACSIANRNLTPEEWGEYMGNQIPYRKTCMAIP